MESTVRAPGEGLSVAAQLRQQCCDHCSMVSLLLQCLVCLRTHTAAESLLGCGYDSLTSKKSSWRRARAWCSLEVKRLTFLPSHLSQSSGGEERTPGIDAQNSLQQQRRKQETLGAVVRQTDSGTYKESENCHLSLSRTVVYFPVPTENSSFTIIGDGAVNILIFILR